MKKNVEIAVSAKESKLTKQLANSYFTNDVKIKKIRSGLKRAVQQWMKTVKERQEASFVMLSGIQELCLGFEKSPKQEKAFREKCRAEHRVLARASTASLCTRHYLRTSRSLSHKYSLAIRGANILGISPTDLAARRNPQDPSKKLTIKYLKDAFLNKCDLKDNHRPTLKPKLVWSDDLAARHAEFASTKEKFVVLISVGPAGESLVTNVSASLKTAKKHLHKLAK